MYNILVIDADQDTKNILKNDLQSLGFKIYSANNGKAGMEKARQKRPDLIVMNIALPDMEGFDILREIKASSMLSNTPVIVLSERNDDFEIVLSLELGAGDYLHKPFSTRELAARIRSQLKYVKDYTRVTEENDLEWLRAGDILVSLRGHMVYIDEKPVIFGIKEHEILKLFIQNEGKVLDKKYITRQIWGVDITGESSLLHVYIHNIRQKLRRSSRYQSAIQTIRGIGYRFKIEENHRISSLS